MGKWKRCRNCQQTQAPGLTAVHCAVKRSECCRAPSEQQQPKHRQSAHTRIQNHQNKSQSMTMNRQHVLQFIQKSLGAVASMRVLQAHMRTSQGISFVFDWLWADAWVWLIDCILLFVVRHVWLVLVSVVVGRLDCCWWRLTSIQLLFLTFILPCFFKL